MTVQTASTSETTRATGATSAATAAATAPTAGNAALASRLPNPVKLVPELGAASGALHKAVANGSVPQRTIDLMQLRAGQIVGNTYLTAMHTKSLRTAGESEERIDAVASWQDAPHFTEAEAVALALVEAVLQPRPHGERVPNELFTRAAAHYDEKALVTLALAIGQVNFFVPLALIGKPLPGVKASEQWT